MATRMSVGIGVLTLLLMGAVVPGVALAKKPIVKPSAPVIYHICWLQGPGDKTEALGVNDSGTVVGYFSNSGYDDPRAFIWTDPVLGIRDLNRDTELGAAIPDGWLLTSAVCITNAGWIAGSMEEQETGERKVYVWNDVDAELSTLSCGELAAIAQCDVERMWLADMNENGVVLGGFDRPEKQGRSCFVLLPDSAPIIIRNLASPDGPYDTPAILASPESIIY